LYQGVGGSFIEIRPLLDGSDPRKKSDEGPRLEASLRKFFAVEKDGALHASTYCLSLCGPKPMGLHVYFGVGLRAKPGKGTKDNIGCVTAAFADIDFKHVPKDKAISNLKALPFKPSIVVLSGNGAHVYWLLEYPAFQSKLPILEALNRKILEACGAQVGTQDATRILRVPGTPNVKPEYPDPKPLAQVVLFEPARRYALEAMSEHFKVSNTHFPPSAPPPEASQASGGGVPLPTPQTAPAREMSQELIQKLAELLTGIWIESYRHYLSVYLAGALAHAGYSQDSATRLIRVVCSLASDGELPDREKAVQGTYQKFVSGEPVAGSPTIEEMIGQFPEVVREKAKKVYEIVKKSIPKEARRGRDRAPDFQITKMVKFDSRPARWICSGETCGGRKFEVECDTQVLANYLLFQIAVFEQSHIMLGELKKDTWRRAIGAIQNIEVRETPKEAKPSGAIETALDEFLETAKLNPELGLLRVYPGYDEDSQFMRMDAFRKTLREHGVKVDENLLFDTIKALGWRSGSKRFGDKVQRLWVKNAPKNGQSHQDPSGQATLFPQKDEKK